MLTTLLVRSKTPTTLLQNTSNHKRTYQIANVAGFSMDSSPLRSTARFGPWMSLTAVEWSMTILSPICGGWLSPLTLAVQRATSMSVPRRWHHRCGQSRRRPLLRYRRPDLQRAAGCLGDQRAVNAYHHRTRLTAWWPSATSVARWSRR